MVRFTEQIHVNPHQKNTLSRCMYPCKTNVHVCKLYPWNPYIYDCVHLYLRYNFLSLYRCTSPDNYLWHLYIVRKNPRRIYLIITRKMYHYSCHDVTYEMLTVAAWTPNNHHSCICTASKPVKIHRHICTYS